MAEQHPVRFVIFAFSAVSAAACGGGEDPPDAGVFILATGPIGSAVAQFVEAVFVHAEEVPYLVQHGDAHLMHELRFRIARFE